METEHMHFPAEFAQIIGFVLFVLAVAYLVWFGIIEGRSIRAGFKGKDGLWQFIETVAYIWLIIFCSACLADVFLGFHASLNMWASLDTIFIALVGGKIGLEHVRKPAHKKEEEIKTSDEG